MSLLLRFLLPGLIFICAGCATHRPELSIWRDARFSPSPTNSIGLTDRPNPTPQDAELGRMLVGEMQQEGFQIVPSAQADFLLTYVLEDVTEKSTMMPRISEDFMADHASMPQTTGQITDQIYTRSYEVRLRTYVPPTFVFHSKAIRLFLYTNPKKNSGEFKLVWQGSIEAGESVPADRELLLLRTLLGYFGKDQNG